MKPNAFLLAILNLAFVLLLSSGCAGYRVGPVNGQPAGARGVTVNMFRNDTYEPRLAETIAFALRRKLQQDGAYYLDTQNEGEIIVNGVITSLIRTPVSNDPLDVLTPRDYEMKILVDVTAKERSSGKQILKREFFGRTVVRAIGNRDLAERQAEPTVAEDLARNIASALTEGSW
jgi:hypothetical protein